MNRYAVSVLMENPLEAILTHSMEQVYAESRDEAMRGAIMRSQEADFMLRSVLVTEIASDSELVAREARKLVRDHNKQYGTTKPAMPL